MTTISNLTIRRPILVAGSAHLEILAFSSERGDVVDRAGDVRIEVGGAGCNVSAHLSHMGAQVRFVTALNRSGYSRVIADYLAEAGVDAAIEYRGDLPTGASSVHLDRDGEMVSGMSSTPVERVVFDMERFSGLARDCGAAILDCCLSGPTLDQMVQIANGLGVPTYIIGVSEEKCLRIAEIEGRVSGVFLTGLEYSFFCREVLGSVLDPGVVARMLGAVLVIDDGPAGAVVALEDGSQIGIESCLSSATLASPGRSEAIAAAVVHGRVQLGLATIDAVQRAFAVAGEIVATHDRQSGAYGTVDSAIQKAQHSAGHDAMTGALNRRSTERELSRVLKQRSGGTEGALSVLILDIDNFKSVNDTWGHNAGDAVIVAVSQVAQQCLRESDFCGRWGGEEFVVSLPNTSIRDALAVAERIRQSVEREVKEPRQITVSIGCAESNGLPAEDLQTLIARADSALYSAKTNGRNRVACADCVAAAA
jgi:diguanylate cyclase (GGDEF)-like protein